VVFVGSNGITLSQSTGAAGSDATITIRGPGAPVTRSYFSPFEVGEQVTGQQGQQILHIQPMNAPNVQFDRFVMPIVNTNSSNSSGSHTLTFWLAIYTRNVSTLSLSISTSSSTAVTHSGTAGSYSLYSGMRLFTIPWTQTLTEGQYFVGILSQTTSGGANGTYSQMMVSMPASSFFGHFGSSVNASRQSILGLAQYSIATAGIPGSIAFTDLRGASSTAVQRRPVFYLASGTV
jgi:hypothetical protein